MSVFPPTLILRHRKENLKKCSLRGLEERSDFLFFTYPKDPLPPLSGYLLLTLDAPPLSIEDHSCGLLLIDATWNYAAIMERQLEQPHLFQKRSLPPSLTTAYPRRQTGCLDPTRGLASIEALFAAYRLLGRETAGLLDHYPWQRRFFDLNLSLDFSSPAP